MKSWTCALVVALAPSVSSASPPAWWSVAIPPSPVNVWPEHGGTFGASHCHAAEIRVSGPASVARDDNSPPTGRSASMGPEFRWFPPRMFDAFEGLHFETFDPGTGDYVLYARAVPWVGQDGSPPRD